MKWIVFRSNFNTKTVEEFNVFDSYNFSKNVNDLKNNPNLSKAEFSEKLMAFAISQFWNRAEYEIILSPWPLNDNDNPIKIDVYSQLSANWEHFVDYVFKELYYDKENDCALRSS